MKKIYLGISILGIIIPFSIFVPWLLVNGLNLSLFVREWLSTPISQFFAADFLITWLAWLVFIFVDHKKKDIPLWWIPFVGNFCIGLSFSVPFYLSLREDKR
ncbi:MAG: DUF2834 domain-containing protein [Clostridium sp.]|uniref:DUF2834 domain-containing protein n=1 Tax=Clostridium sp. TaxID=1506 RepID=UPI002911B80E|nr:DUF2834 domain-containing protein [Clostridium sp.]MDU7337739.1 DUF2834 domain-containing protein [Clostridium sp.]